MRPGQALGARGEELAADFLQRAGLEILRRNARSALGELDLVARDGDEIIFVEVKTRVGAADTAADQSVTSAKLARLSRLAELYLASQGWGDAAWRLDVVAVVVDGQGELRSIDHLQGAFL